MSARPGLCGGYHASDIPTAISQPLLSVNAVRQESAVGLFLIVLRYASSSLMGINPSGISNKVLGW
jgi:hypothetical protein